MTLTLTRTLEIDIKLIPLEEDKGLQVARELWAYDGRPTEAQALRRSLERILTLCQREGIRYPAILLRRKKELERGTWAPDPAVAIPEELPGDPQCPNCHGLGYTLNPGGFTGTGCDCYLRKNAAKRNLAAPGRPAP